MTDELLQKYIKGEASEAERKQVTLWLMESPENTKRYRAERKLFESLLWKEAAKDEREKTRFHVMNQESKGKNKMIPVRHFLREVCKVAAVVAVTLMAVTWFTDKTPDNVVAYQEMVVPAGQRAELNLSDGTKVWLNSGSTLTFPTSFSDKVRQVTLDGEGYFEVTKNAACPFVVETNKGNIRVLGTEFNVMAYHDNDTWETSLLKGSVEIVNPDFEESVIRLEPNMKVSIRDNQFVKEDIGETSRFLWREGLLCFSNISVKEMFQKVELYYGVTIQVNNERLLNKKYTGKFRTKDGVEHVLKVLQLNHDFTYTKNDENNTIIINQP